MLSRTDSIGDVVLTLPVAGLLKKYFPACRIVFLGRTYTKDVVALSHFVDDFLNFDELMAMPGAGRKSLIKACGADVFMHVFPRRSLARLAFAAGVRHRVGTRSRWYHWMFCNRLLKLPRKNSNLHEAQLNLRMLKFFGIPVWVPLEEIRTLYGFSNIPVLEAQFAGMLDPARVNVILHPRSKGSAVEWGLGNFSELVKLLSAKKFKVFVSGTAEDEAGMKEFLARNGEVHNLCGKMSLQQFIAFIARADGLVAASTGPLHIAAALGTRAVGLYSGRRPLFPRRWAPLGRDAHALVLDPNCSKCRAGTKCECVQNISPSSVMAILDK